MHSQIGFLWKVLAKQAVGVFVRTALPRAFWVAKVNVDFCCQFDLFVIRHFRTAILCQRTHHPFRQRLAAPLQCAYDAGGVFALDLDQRDRRT